MKNTTNTKNGRRPSAYEVFNSELLEAFPTNKGITLVESWDDYETYRIPTQHGDMIVRVDLPNWDTTEEWADNTNFRS